MSYVERCSDLLFPAFTGGFRTQKALNVPIAEVATELGITKHLTQRALRRTFSRERSRMSVHAAPW